MSIFDCIKCYPHLCHCQQEEYMTDKELCPTCDGTGEGMHDGARCHACGGSGVDRGDDDRCADYYHGDDYS